MTEDETIRNLIDDLGKYEDQAKACEALGLTVQARRVRVMAQESRLTLVKLLRSEPAV